MEKIKMLTGPSHHDIASQLLEKLQARVRVRLLSEEVLSGPPQLTATMVQESMRSVVAADAAARQRLAEGLVKAALRELLLRSAP
jgi:hypothetical protein